MDIVMECKARQDEIRQGKARQCKKWQGKANINIKDKEVSVTESGCSKNAIITADMW